MAYRVSKEEFALLVQRALDDLPPRFAEFIEEVPVEIRDRPTPQMLRTAGLGGGSLLLGLYHGHPRTRRSVEDSARLPDVIYVFQDSIEHICNSEQDLIDQVRKTVLHEIGHHFGMTEDDLDALGYG